MNQITVNTALEVAHHEALVREAYKDSVGVWTWSIGLTSASGHDVSRYIDNPQPLERCLDVYVWALDNYADDVREVMGDDLPEHVFAAALSFHWNTGAIRRASWVKSYKQGDMDTAEKHFMLWRRPSEIIPRREAEADLLFRGEWSNQGTTIEYDVTSNHTPNWGSGRAIEIASTLKSLLEDAPAPPLNDPSNEVLLAEIADEFIQMCAKLRDEHPDRAREFSRALTKAEEALLWARHGLN